jgi:hypothetical protein
MSFSFLWIVERSRRTPELALAGGISVGCGRLGGLIEKLGPDVVSEHHHMW